MITHPLKILKTSKYITFKLLSGPFQHLSPLEKNIILYESSNLSQRLQKIRKLNYLSFLDGGNKTFFSPLILPLLN